MREIARTGIIGRILQRGAKVAALLAAGRSRLFTYDELMNIETLEGAKVYPTRSVVAFAEGYGLAPAITTAEDGIGQLSLVRQAGGKVYGIVHEVSTVEILLLEALLALSGGKYQRTMVLVVDEHGAEERVWTLVARRAATGLKCRKALVTKMIAMAEGFTFPPSHVARLETLPTSEHLRVVSCHAERSGTECHRERGAGDEGAVLPSVPAGT